MGFYDYAWSLSHEITKKDQGQIKILLSEDKPYPTIGTDRRGYVLHLAGPRKLDQTHSALHGGRFPEDEQGKLSLWHMFAASVQHLSLHVAISDFTIYAQWSRGKNPNLAAFALSLAEDSHIRAYSKGMWRGLLPTIAQANALSYLRLKPQASISNLALKAQAALLSHFMVGQSKGSPPKMIERDIADIVKPLEEFEIAAQNDAVHSDPAAQRESTQDRLNSSKLKIADTIYRGLSRYGTPPEAASIPYSDSHGRTTIFEESISLDVRDREQALKSARWVLDLDSSAPEIQDDPQRDRVLNTWESVSRRRDRIQARYAELAKESHLRSFGVPPQDYGEYLRIRGELSGSIRRSIEQLRQYWNEPDEDLDKESGNLDLATAIQVVASQSRRNDVFIREEPLLRKKSWSILIDSSSSLETFAGSVRGVATCLAEIGKEVITNPTSWSLSAFDDKYHILKDFSEDFTNEVRYRIGGLTQGGMTLLPDAMNLAAAAQASGDEDLKCMIIVTDGVPSGYEGIEDELRETVSRIERKGVLRLIGVGVEGRGIKKHFRSSCWASTPHELMKQFVKIYLEIVSMI